MRCSVVGCACLMAGVAAIAMTSLVATVATLGPQYSPSSGRHVCGVERFSGGGPVKRSYCVPQFESYVRPCQPFDLTSGYCTGYRTVYKTVTQIVQRKRRKRMAFLCCPGWSREPAKYGCTKPICQNSCHNNGVCLQPNVCRCRAGFEGKLCEQDVDECKTNNGGCDQYCVNLPGSFSCGCRSGYTLGVAGKTCEVCVTCSKEWKQMEARLESLETVIRGLPNSFSEDKAKSAPQQRSAEQQIPLPQTGKPLLDDDKESSSIQSPVVLRAPATVQGQNANLLPGRKGMKGDRGEKGAKGDPGNSYEDDSHTDALKILVEKVAILEAKLEECQCSSTPLYRSKRATSTDPSK